LAEAKSGNVGSASHMGENKLSREAHFVFDYTGRRVPIPVNVFMAIADTPVEHGGEESAGKIALDMLHDLIQPAAITEDELAPSHMESLVKDSLARINSELLERARQENAPGAMQVSLTFVVADGGRAYIGHAGTNRVYLLQDERLYDLTPALGLASAAPSPEEPSLFPIPTDEEKPPPELPPTPPAERSRFLGQSEYAAIGYNEVEISPGGVIILASDGMLKSVSEEEIVEHLLSGVTVQRSVNQLTRLASSRDPSDNATMVAWKHAPSGEAVRKDVKEVRVRVRKERTSDSLIITLLVIVLVGIFAVGFAFGWKITDAVRKPVKESKKTTQTATNEKKATGSAVQEQTAAQPAQPVTKTATVTAQSARMRATATPAGQIVYTLSKGEQVTVLGEVTGTDGKAWIKARATVKSGNASNAVEGFIRKDLVLVTASTTSATAP
jgi:serine/threonine protein phosphatase PrpC